VSVFVIAEAGVNHNGDVDRALRMIDAAVAARADAIKFQTFSAEKLVSRSAEKAAYQKRETGEGSQFGMLKALEMSDDMHRQLFEHCRRHGIEFMSTPFDEDAADFLIALGMRRLKVPSGELVNHPFLRHLASKNLPIILSTGMAEMHEVEEAVATLEQEGATSSLTVLHCTSNYPAAMAEVNLRAMTTIGERTGLPVGYSDHTLGVAVAIAAVARGATVIEKHFTLDRELPGPDHRASLEPDELAEMVRAIRDVEIALGSAEKSPTAAELEVRKVARRSIAAARDLHADQLLRSDDLVLLRPGTGIAPKELDRVTGRTLARPVAAGTPLQWADLA
jgi:N,N'-diacetyllegionaminate synthase